MRQVQEAEEALIIRRARLDLQDFVRLAAWFRDEEAEAVRRAFEAHAGAGGAGGVFDRQRLNEALCALGYVGLLDTIAAGRRARGGRGDVQPSLTELLRASETCVRQRRERLRRSRGFSGPERFQLTLLFEEHAGDDCDTVAGKEFWALLEAVNEQYYPSLHARAGVFTFKESHITFAGFLDAVRVWQDRAEFAEVRREQEVVQAMGLSATELEGFRGIFDNATGRNSRFLSYAGLAELVFRIMPSLQHASQEPLESASETFGQLLARTGPCRHERLDFPQFLQVLQRLQDEDWQNINGSVEAIAMEAQRRNEATRPGYSPWLPGKARAAAATRPRRLSSA